MRNGADRITATKRITASNAKKALPLWARADGSLNMEDIVKTITAAEAQAEEIRAAALARAAEIAAQAELRASAVLKNAEEECKNSREEKIREAEAQAQARYEAALEESRSSAESYADGLLNKADGYVKTIVRRICGGDR